MVPWGASLIDQHAKPPAILPLKCRSISKIETGYDFKEYAVTREAPSHSRHILPLPEVPDPPTGPW